MIKTIIFDKDGVLLDLAATWFPVAQKMTELLDEYTDGKYGAAFFQSIIGIDASDGSIDHGGTFASGSFTDQRRDILSKVPELEPHFEFGSEYHKRMHAFVEQNYERDAVAKGPVKQVLQELRADGFKLAMLTNDAEYSARKSSTQLGILPLFEMIVGFDSGFGGKPDPNGYHAICDKLGTPPEFSVMVGDTQADSGVANAAGARHFIGVSILYPERTSPLVDVPHIMPDISLLPELLRKLD